MRQVGQEEAAALIWQILQVGFCCMELTRDTAHLGGLFEAYLCEEDCFNLAGEANHLPALISTQ
jgi:hypothetical protein